MNKNTIQSLWVGPSLSQMEVMCIQSYLSHGHEFHLYTYENVENVPVGTIIKDANQIIPEKDIYVDAFGGYVNLSNKFRYTLLYKMGGWWVDMDTVCLRHFDFEEDFVFSSEFSEPYNRYVVNTTFIKSLPGSKYLADCLHFLQSRGYHDMHWGELGVNLFSRMIFRNNLAAYIKPPHYFCPVSPHELRLLITKDAFDLTANSYALHWWNEIWKRLNLDKNGAFPEGSTYEMMKSKYSTALVCEKEI